MLWALADWALAGSPLHSLTGTRDTAATLGRVTGLDDVPLTVPRRLGEILREPVLLGAVGGLALSWLWLRDRVRPAIVAGVLALAAFCVLAAVRACRSSGATCCFPPRSARSSAAPGAFGWRSLPEGDRRRRPWAWFGLRDARRAARLRPRPGPAHRRPARRAAHPGRRSRTTCARSSGGRRARWTRACTPVGVPNHRPIPLLALWLDVRPERVVSLQERAIARGAYARPATARVARDYVLDPRDRDKAIPPPPPGFTLAAANRSWRVFRACAP